MKEEQPASCKAGRRKSTNLQDIVNLPKISMIKNASQFFVEYVMEN